MAVLETPKAPVSDSLQCTISVLFQRARVLNGVRAITVFGQVGCVVFGGAVVFALDTTTMDVCKRTRSTSLALDSGALTAQAVLEADRHLWIADAVCLTRNHDVRVTRALALNANVYNVDFDISVPHIKAHQGQRR